MPAQAQTFEAGESFLTKDGRVVQVLSILSDGSLTYRFRRAATEAPLRWTGAIAVPPVFAALVERPVPCDWTPDAGSTHPASD